MISHEKVTTPGFDFRSAMRLPDKLDSYLVDIAKRFERHRYLAGATQGLYRSQISMLKSYAEYKYGDISKVRVLDWGAGKGHISYLLRCEGFDVVSCDLDCEADDSPFTQEIPIIEDHAINLIPLKHTFKLPFENDEFDMVVSFGVLEHVEQDFQSLKEISRVLKKNGSFGFFFLPFWLSWSQKLAHLRGNFYHSHLYNKNDLTVMAKQAGFRVEDMWHGQLFPKNIFPYNKAIENIDRFLCKYTPLKYFATNLEGILIVE